MSSLAPKESESGKSPEILGELHKPAEETSRHNWAQLQAIFEAVSAGIVVSDMDGRIVLVNEALARMNGYENASEMYKELACFDRIYELRTMGGEIVPMPEWPISKVLRGESVNNWELYARRKDTGQEWFFSFSGSPVRDAAGRQILAVVTKRDITIAKRAEEALIRSEKLASVGRMAATVAHEINNPLAAVMNLLYLARNNQACPQDIREDLSKAEAELKRVSHITRQVLGFHRDVAGQTLVSVAEVLDEALDLFQTRIAAKRAKLQKQYGHGIQITAAAGELRQVVSNLIVNSLDAIAEGGAIALRISETVSPAGKKLVRITVADDGMGINPLARPYVFEPLFTTKESVGTGLGLWVSKQLVEKHGGWIRFRSSTRPGRRGTTFSIVLPDAGPGP